MFRFLPAPIAGSLAMLLLIVHTTVCACLIVMTAPVKIVLRPFRKDTKFIPFYRAAYHLWYKALPYYFRLFGTVKINIHLPKNKIEKDKSGLLISNHQSWVDILIVAGALSNKIASPTFFLKQELIWVPIVGLPCWVMDHIFVKRYSKKELEKNPELKGQDIKTAKRKCRKLKNYPTTVINFVEGTRLTSKKYEQSPKKLKHLLPAKAGGINFTLNALGKKITYLLDVSIVYHTDHQDKIMWQILTGRVREIDLHIRNIPLEESLFGNYEKDHIYRENFQNWLNDIWQEKDLIIDKLHS